eukprot:TRINITY_DN1103_c0_g1_i1.p2 TRINITY_DN1103_c0_g1~~TRINITY_DN1103_c0_g1_i1.p2  ORF type:complete len:117 (-),score=10.73 TRINITY_DN1103_c0_g1_i1:376-726(-)
MEDSLLNLLKDGKVADAGTKVSVAIDVASGLAYLHRNGIVHADIAARNVLCSSNNGSLVAKLCDFGLALDARGGLSEHLKDPYPVRWAAPETFVRAKPAPPRDVFSFGAIRRTSKP